MNGRECFNLFLGDWDEEINSANDFIVSNNQDSQKVLVTVAQIVLDFTKSYPNATIYANGNTPSRTRLYQMGISKYWFNTVKNKLFKKAPNAVFFISPPHATAPFPLRPNNVPTTFKYRLPLISFTVL
jgi:hypothetical protein